jgi:putative transposase
MPGGRSWSGCAAAYNPQRQCAPGITDGRCLRGYDYASPGAYFLTLCAQHRACVFGEIVDATFRPVDAGRMVEAAWRELPASYRGVGIDGFVAMPNHIHGIVVLVGAAPRGRPSSGQAQGPAPTADSVADIVRRFKTITMKRYADGVRQLRWRPFDGRLWQRGYYERVIRNAAELDRIRRYIIENPMRWATDAENPAAGEGDS